MNGSEPSNSNKATGGAIYIEPAWPDPDYYSGDVRDVNRFSVDTTLGVTRDKVSKNDMNVGILVYIRNSNCFALVNVPV